MREHRNASEEYLHVPREAASARRAPMGDMPLDDVPTDDVTSGDISVTANSHRMLRPANAPHHSLDEIVASTHATVHLPNDVSGDNSASGTPVTGMTLRSSAVEPGDIFIALPGTHTHGAIFASEAVSLGAAAILTNREGVSLLSECPVPVLEVDDLREAMTRGCSRLWDHPVEALDSFAVTGTNGKTTTVFMLESALHALGHHVGTIGTMGFRYDGQTFASERTTITTPDAPEFHMSVAAFRDLGADSLAMEVSSHALDQRRLAGVRFDCAGFTNLGRDHLDYHHTMDEYFSVKARLFTPEMARRAVIVLTDDYSRRLVTLARRAGLEVTTVGRSEGDFSLTSLTAQAGHLTYTLETPHGSLTGTLAMPGDYNAVNAALAVAMIDAQLHCDLSELRHCAHAISKTQVPGRMELIDLPAGWRRPPRVYVDFGHTPQAIESALSCVPEPRIAVLGAGGERDQDKRPLMGASAARWAQCVIVTDDNPRGEDPALIRKAVAQGAREAAYSSDSTSHPVEVYEVDGRAQAITEALRRATEHHSVVILGKGHERTQRRGNSDIPFHDPTEVRRAWQRVLCAEEKYRGEQQ